VQSRARRDGCSYSPPVLSRSGETKAGCLIEANHVPGTNYSSLAGPQVRLAGRRPSLFIHHLRVSIHCCQPHYP
jgi:hypothetical protein